MSTKFYLTKHSLNKFVLIILLFLSFGQTSGQYKYNFKTLTDDFDEVIKQPTNWDKNDSINAEKEEALNWLEEWVNLGCVNYPLFSKDPFLENIRGEKRFKKLMERVKYEWENFEL